MSWVFAILFVIFWKYMVGAIGDSLNKESSGLLIAFMLFLGLFELAFSVVGIKMLMMWCLQ